MEFDGNIDTEANVGYDSPVNPPHNGKMSYYQQIGQLLLRQQAQAQQQVQAGNGNISSDTGNLTGGFNMNWLSQALASGSANGAKI